LHISQKYITFAGELCGKDFVVIIKKWAGATQFVFGVKERVVSLTPQQNI